MHENILAFDTSLPHASLWLHLDGQDYYYDAVCPQGSAQTVFGWLKQIITSEPELFSKISCYALNIGPGRFNGVRLALSIVGTMMALHPKRIYTCTTFDLLKAIAGPDIDHYAVFAKKGHAYALVSGQETHILPFAELPQSQLAALQCPELPAQSHYDFIHIKTMGRLIAQGLAQCYERFEDVVPVYSALS